MSGPVIRAALDEEYEQVDEFIRVAYEHDYGPREHRDDPMRFARNRARTHEVWVALDGATRELLGSVTTARADGEPLMEDAGDDLAFRLLAVAPTARRRGVGAALTRHVIELARERGVARVFLKSAPQMSGAHSLYLGLGFRRDPDRDGLWDAGKKVLDLYAFVIDVTPVTTWEISA